MNKSCDNCYYKIGEKPRNALKNITSNFCIMVKDKPIENICHMHTLGCESCSFGDSYNSEATFKYNGKFYCESWCAEAVGIEIRPYTAYQYYDAHGDFLGDSETTELQDILLNCSVVEYIGDDE